MQIHRGKIKHFNGQYGFISYEKGEIYFHRTGLRVHGYISQGEEVEFKIESSPIIKDKFQAFDIALIEINLESIIETYLIGQIDWFEFEKGYGIIIGPDNKEYFLHISKYQGDKKFLAEKNFYVFEGEEKDGRLYAVNCRYADKKLLTSYLNAKKTIVSEYPEFYFSIWIKGFIDDKDIEYISSKLSNNTFGWELYRTIFKRVSNPIEQKLLLYKFLERVLIIDTKEKYENVKIIAQLIELNKEVKLWFIKEIENKANEEIKFLLWLEGYTNDKDLKYIEIMVSIGLGAKSFNLIMKIFKRLSDPNEQIELLISVFDSLDDDEASSKYQKIKYLFDLDGVSENVDTSIKQYVYMKSDEEVKLLMWLDNYTELVDINCLAKRLAQENIHFVSRKIDFIFNMITGMEEQRELLHYFLKGLVDLVGNEDYEKVKLLSGHLNLNESIKSNFLNDAYKIASI